MAKLFAPILESKLPVRIFTDNKDGKKKIEFYYKKSLGVSYNDYRGYIKFRIKNITTGTQSKDFEVGKYSDNNKVVIETECIKAQGCELNNGDYIKIQIAFVQRDNNDKLIQVGQFSNAGVFRYLTAVSYITTAINKFMVKGIVDNIEGVENESIVKERYVIYDASNENIREESEWLFGTNIGQGYQLKHLPAFFFNQNKNGNVNVTIVIEYEYYLTSGFYEKITIEAPIKFIKQQPNTSPNPPPDIFEYDANNGRMKIKSYSTECSMFKWDQTQEKININYEALSAIQDKYDYDIEQGKNYTYGFYTVTTTSQSSEDFLGVPGYIFTLISAYEKKCLDFEDILIYDGQKQLKLSYNPTVSSYKSTLLETKTNTIGGKYPFIFRNGDVNYKEFTISGLLSVMLDEDYCFIDLPSEEEKFNSKTDITTYNIYREREFKINVYNWLTNGSVKLLRTPTEGNFLVNFMNVSMTPEDTLGRMLHTINMTAVEIDTYNIQNLQKYELLF